MTSGKLRMEEAVCVDGVRLPTLYRMGIASPSQAESMLQAVSEKRLEAQEAVGTENWAGWVARQS